MDKISKTKKGKKAKAIGGKFISAALGIAAGIALIPESGGKFFKDAKKKSAEFHAYLAPQFEEKKRVGKQEYHSSVKNAMESYAKIKHLSEKEKKGLVSQAKELWKHIQKHSS